MPFSALPSVYRQYYAYAGEEQTFSELVASCFPTSIAHGAFNRQAFCSVLHTSSILAPTVPFCFSYFFYASIPFTMCIFAMLRVQLHSAVGQLFAGILIVQMPFSAIIGLWLWRLLRNLMELTQSETLLAVRMYTFLLLTVFMVSLLDIPRLESQVQGPWNGDA